MVTLPARLSESVARRVRVLLVRQRLERLAALLRRQALAPAPAEALDRNVVQRLMLLTAGADPDHWSEAFGLARRAGAVYKETSAVLHSNRAFADVPEALVREWEQVTEELASAVTAAAP